MQNKLIAIVLLWCLAGVAPAGLVHGKSYKVTVLNSDCGLSQHDCECIL